MTFRALSFEMHATLLSLFLYVTSKHLSAEWTMCYLKEVTKN